MQAAQQQLEKYSDAATQVQQWQNQLAVRGQELEAAAQVITLFGRPDDEKHQEPVFLLGPRSHGPVACRCVGRLFIPCDLAVIPTKGTVQ